MGTDYSALLKDYPPIISKDQLYRICHISKRKATWLLENGIIPCEDTGKKTRRFKIRIIDVIQYLETLENSPEQIVVPVGIFNGTGGKAQQDPVTLIPQATIRNHLKHTWQDAPDALTPNQAAELTGYTLNTIRHWLSEQQLQNISCPHGRVIAKAWLIRFMSGYIPTHPAYLSIKLQTIVGKLID